MYAEERRQAIIDRARRSGRVEVASLATSFDVTPETIRRDLTELERQGVLRRVHGGAIPVERFRSEPAVAEKASRMAEQKHRIAGAALAYVPEGGTVLLDSGTTTQALAEILPGGGELTVVTNSAPLALTLATRPALNLLMIGGRVRGRTLANVDEWALRALDELRVDIAFVATNGISIDRGLTTHDQSEAAVKRAMVRSGRRVILLADHTKLGSEHLIRFASPGDLDVWVTDDAVEETAVKPFVEHGVEVVRA